MNSSHSTSLAEIQHSSSPRISTYLKSVHRLLKVLQFLLLLHDFLLGFPLHIPYLLLWSKDVDFKIFKEHYKKKNPTTIELWVLPDVLAKFHTSHIKLQFLTESQNVPITCFSLLSEAADTILWPLCSSNLHNAQMIVWSVRQ